MINLIEFELLDTTNTFILASNIDCYADLTVDLSWSLSCETKSLFFNYYYCKLPVVIYAQTSRNRRFTLYSDFLELRVTSYMRGIESSVSVISSKGLKMLSGFGGSS